jgi:hypothetical protein
MDNGNDKNASSSDISGRKIFFLYPTAPVQNQIITELAQQEYEAYIAKDHNRLMRVLKNCSDSIIYVNIDDKMQEAEWEKWITSILSSFPDIKVGIFTSNTSDEYKHKYTEKIKITCGYMPLKLDMSKALENVLAILAAMNVKGRRKYLRAFSENETTTTMNMPLDGDFVNSNIRDISVVGFSCFFEHDPGLKKNALHKDIQIRLQTNLLKVEAVVFGSREESGKIIYVFLFTQRIDPDIKVKIRKYIQQNLQSKMDKEIN